VSFRLTIIDPTKSLPNVFLEELSAVAHDYRICNLDEAIRDLQSESDASSAAHAWVIVESDPFHPRLRSLRPFLRQHRERMVTMLLLADSPFDFIGFDNEFPQIVNLSDSPKLFRQACETLKNRWISQSFETNGVTGSIPVSPFVQRMRSAIQKSLARRSALLLLGETGSGKHHVAQEIVHTSGLPTTHIFYVSRGHQLHRGEALRHSNSKSIPPLEGEHAIVVIDEITDYSKRDIDDFYVQVQRVLGSTRSSSNSIIQKDGSLPIQWIGLATTDRRDRNVIKQIQDALGCSHLDYLTLPRVVERLDELELIVASWLVPLCEHLGCDPVSIDQHAWEFLHSYEWPGNWREMRLAISGAVLCGKSCLTSHELMGWTLQSWSSEPMDFADSRAIRSGLREIQDKVLERAHELACSPQVQRQIIREIAGAPLGLPLATRPTIPRRRAAA
jgi:hypothetical protein